MYRAAKCYERNFIYSGDFAYSLDLRPPADPALDPIEDFIVNQRQGHCQYFAAAMVAMLRKQGVPSRLVAGYRPVEFNAYGYFFVRQSDAHAWAEGLFTREQLENSELAKWLTPEQKYYWVRFDPTPSSEGGEVSIVEQPGQAIDFAQKLWKDYVVDAQKLSGENSIYAPVSENGDGAYVGFIERFKKLIANLREGKLFDEGQGLEFAWPLAVIVFLAGGMVILAWRFLVMLPGWAPNLAKRLGLGQSQGQKVNEAFFAKCLQMLERQGLKRKKSQTPQEFTEAAAESLGSQEDVEQSLDLLTRLYYGLRFGAKEELDASEVKAVDGALQDLATHAHGK